MPARAALRAALSTLLLVAALLAARPARADLASALAAAARTELATTRGWQRLLLHRSHLLGAGSDVDGGAFFLAPDGKTDPAAELRATLRALYAPAGAADSHASCTFPARRRLLVAALGLTDLPEPACPALAAWLADLDVGAVSVVFASNYADNPASAFGHTLLHLRRRAGHAGEDHGVDYTARTDTRNPVVYTLKGVGGYFPGLFRFLPYPQMLREYGTHESRDLWEYDLALAPGEVEQLVLHLWELAGARLDYLYFTENCSYEILAALDAAAPRLDLVAALHGVVIPIDTVKLVARAPGLVERVRYRPSARSLFHASTGQLDDADERLAVALAAEPETSLAGLPPARAALVLDTARLALETRFGKDLGTSGFASARDRLVARRDALGVATVPLVLEPLPSRRPDASHPSMRAIVGSGTTSQYGSGFATLGWRFALHDLADPPDGNPELLELQFLDVRLRYDYGRRALTLDRLTFAELTDLHPLGRYEKAVSWRVRGFGTRLHDRAANDTFAHGLEVGFGAALGTRSERLVAFVLADASVAFGQRLDGIGGSFVRLGLGPSGGVRWHVFDDTVAVVSGGAAWLPGQRLGSTFDLRASVRSGLGRHVALGLEGAAQPLSREIQLASYVYF